MCRCIQYIYNCFDLCVGVFDLYVYREKFISSSTYVVISNLINIKVVFAHFKKQSFETHSP